jgi:hypothetical protein
VICFAAAAAMAMASQRQPPRRKTILDRKDKNFFLDVAQRKPPTLESPRPHDMTKPPE